MVAIDEHACLFKLEIRLERPSFQCMSWLKLSARQLQTGKNTVFCERRLREILR